MAIASAQTNEGVSTSATIAVAFGSAPTSGNLITLHVTADATLANLVADGWTASSEMQQIDAHEGALLWRISNGSNSMQYRLSGAAPSAWVLCEWSGVDATPYDVSEGQRATPPATSYTTASMTPTAGDRLLIAQICGSKYGNTGNDLSGDLTTWTNSFTHLRTSGHGTGSPADKMAVGVGYRLVTANGSTAYSSGATYPYTADARSALIIAFKAAAGGGSQSLTQSSLFQNSSTFPSGQIKGLSTVGQSARFDNSNTFYAATVSAIYTLAQSSRFNNSNTYPSGTINPGAVALTQTARFTNANSFYAGTIAGIYTLAQSSRFNNANTFYGGAVSVGSVTLTQSSRFNNANTFYGGIVSAGGSVLIGTLFENQNTFFGGTVTSKNTLAQSSRFDNQNTFHAGAFSSTYALVGTLFQNVNTFYGGTIVSNIQNIVGELFENENTFFGGTISGGGVFVVQDETYSNEAVFFHGKITRIGYEDIPADSDIWTTVGHDTDIWTTVPTGVSGG